MHAARGVTDVLASSIDDDASLAHLAQVLAHRLRGLVAGIEGYTDLLADTLNAPDQRELAMKIMEGAARIESVLADLQLYGESLEAVMLPVRIEEILRDLLVPLPEEDAGRIHVVHDPEKADAVLLADPFLIRQALLILIQNALDTNAGSIEVGSARNDGHIRFHVKNPGTIDVEEAREVVFVPFYTTKAHNLGVGLSIARRIARMHEGGVELTANSRKEGTCFTLSIPESTYDDLR